MNKTIIFLLVGILALALLGCPQPAGIGLDDEIQIKTIDAVLTREGVTTSERATDVIQSKIDEGETVESVMQGVKKDYEEGILVFLEQEVELSYVDNNITITPPLQTTLRTIEEAFSTIETMMPNISNMSYTYSDGHLDIIVDATKDIFIHPFGDGDS